ncbi:Ypt/Rab-GAP domain of gyp1p superfamily protein [Perilla frutescens var. hirtella]|nr:Ypt/Rab-GAP domain of gyp1p superfamily protein [Perilla frutescens var. hirtella]
MGGGIRILVKDSYGFTVRPQHVHRYREYSSIYKEEEGERLEKWKEFLVQQEECARASHSKEEHTEPVVSEVTEQSGDPGQSTSEERDDSAEQCAAVSEVTAVEKVSGEEENPSEVTEQSSEKRDDSAEQCAAVSEVTAIENVCGGEENSSKKRSEGGLPSREAPSSQHGKRHEVKTWADISPSLNCIDHMMSVRIKKTRNMKSRNIRCESNDLPSIDETRPSDGGSDDDNERSDTANAQTSSDKLPPETSFSWKEELASLVRGGVPKDLRGEVWQAFVGVRTRRVEKYYQDLLAVECDATDGKEHDNSASEGKKGDLPEKLKKQIEKDLPRTFPGHPALNETGRNSLRRVLSAYAIHNPSVGYCQAMNFFAGLLLLMMPEENAFWTLVGIIDEYFEGYFSQEMTESQVDQLVFEDLMRERFPKLVNHLDYLGVEVAWISGPWFLSIFVNTLPWESVLRVWDVILFEGNRVMLFRTALALMDLYGPALVTTKDAGDVITLLQTLTGSTFDSSQLVLTACMGFLNITEDRLQELRQKHRPSIVSTFEERSKGGKSFKDPKGLATKLYSFKHDRGSIVKENETEAGLDDNIDLGEIPNLDSHSASLDEFLKGMSIDSEADSLPDLQEQVVWLKVELCRLLEEKRSEALKSEELEAAFMEMVQEDNRMELAAKVEKLEKEVAELRQLLADKKEGENAMLQVLLKVEQEQRETDQARRFAEQEAATHKQALHALQEKYDKAMADMEKRVVMAESMLEATLQYETGQSKASSSPKSGRPELQDNPSKKAGILSFGLGWRDRSKASNDDTGNVPDETDDQQE